MRPLLTVFVFLCCCAKSFSQGEPAPTTRLSSEETTILFPAAIRQALDITYPIFRVYKYTDELGCLYTVLTESNDQITEEGDTLNTKIKVLQLLEEHGTLRKLWEVKDEIGPEESSIQFWTKFTDFVDHDRDGIVEPLLIYGTSAENGYDDGHVKILMYFKGQKIAIKHQNGILDSERITVVDRAFYNLPMAVQDAVKDKIEMLQDDNLAIFPYGWQQALKKKKLRWTE